LRTYAPEQAAGRTKAEHRRVSRADCFCATLADRLHGEVLTTDRHEMAALASAGVWRVRFMW
jgi:hypothetical protein